MAMAVGVALTLEYVRRALAIAGTCVVSKRALDNFSYYKNSTNSP